MDKKTVRDLDVAGKKVLVRVDFNVPLNDKGEITDDTRITASLPTIQYLLEQKAAVILMAHLGRPKGQVKPELSLAPVAKHLGKLLGKKILFAPDCVGEAAQAAASKLKPGHILLLENLRFHKEEEKNDMEFAEKLASLADLYVNDGFGVSHRAHASVEGVTHFLPAAAGFLLEKEIQYVGQAVTNPLHPFVAIIGGAKVSDKIGVISNLLDKVDTLLIGGGMANTFLAAQGYKMGKSLVEEDKLDLAKELLAKAKKNKVNMLLPTDLVMAAAFAPDAEHVTEKVKNLNQAYMALDIGAETSKAYAEALAELDGVGNAQKIIDALQPLRDRVGMPPVDFDREYNQEADYGFRNLDKYIQAVRRERRVEKACEGRRQEDIMRWAAADELIVGKWPKGALFVGSNLENHPVYGDKLIYDQASGNNLFLTGKPGDPLRYIIPTNPAGYESGWKFDVNRDYLLPIQTRMLGDLTGGMWEQNPGW